MANELRVAILVHMFRRPGVEEALRERTWRDCFEPMLGAFHHTPEVKIGLVLGGELLEDFVSAHPEAIEWIRELLQRKQVELVGTAFHEPVLSAIPERDATAQIQAHATLIKKIYGVRPVGCWLPHGIWDPSLPRVLSKAGMEWSAIEDRHLVDLGTTDEGIYGVYRTEREGFPLGMLPIDTRVAEMAGDVEVKQVFVHLRRRAQRRHGLVTLAFDAATFGLRPNRNPRADQTWFATLLAGLAKAAPAVQTVLPSEAIGIGPERGRVYFPSAAPVGVGVPWERNLARYAEANRLHKKMLRVSRQVYKLERMVREGAHSDYRPDPEKLVQAHRYLYRAQAADVYWHHRHAGIYDPVLRQRTWRDLLRAERVTLEAMRTNMRMLVDTSDLDCDGVPEVVLRTPSVSVVIDPALAGGITEFSVFEGARNLVNTMSRVAEPYHSDPAVMGDLGDVGDDDDITDMSNFMESAPTVRRTAEGTSVAALARDLRMGLGADDAPRTCFIERFLGPDVTLDNVRRGNYTPVGRGLDRWTLVTNERKADEALRAVLGCDAVVSDSTGERKVHLSKRYTVRREPTLECRLEVQNRSHEALRTRLAVELNLTLGADPEQQMLEVAGQKLPINVPSDAGEVSELRLVGEGADVQIKVEKAARLWYYPVHTIHRSDGQVVRATQGICLLFLWPVELWGKEKFKAGIAIRCDSDTQTMRRHPSIAPD